MKRLAAAVSILCVVGIALAQDAPLFDFKKAITVEDYEACGLGKLSKEEMASLSKLVARIRDEALREATNPAQEDKKPQPRSGEQDPARKAEKCTECGGGKQVVRCDLCEKGRATCPTCAGKTVAIGPCKPCNVTGRCPCGRCSGYGYWNCATCKGSGRVSEWVTEDGTHGSRRIEIKKVCPACNGQKAHSCPDCERSGRVTCPICLGSAQSESRCVKCEGSGRVSCRVCGGDGWKPCPSCKAAKSK